jgi:hypothetical protein
VPTELLTEKEPTASAPIPPDDELRKWARRHLERVRRVKLHAAAFVLGMLVLTPVWALTQWADNGGFKRFDFSPDGTPGDWEPWILYVALIWGGLVAIAALRAYFDRPTTEAEIDHEVERLRSNA